MNASTLNKFTISGIAAVLLLPWLSVAAAGESANAPHAPVVLDRHSALGANDCISLGSDRRMTEAITPVLRNRCDYAVSVSYCVADDGAAVRACDTGSQRITKTLGAHEMVRIEATDYNIVNKDINWIACRSYAGVVSTFSQDGTRGQCLPDNTMQATTQTRSVLR
ncbi:MAG TPA: hypothetical protein VIR56_12325 [Solimonas sp.]